MVIFFQFYVENFTNSLFWSDKNVLMKNNKNETEKLMDVRKKSLSPNKKSNAEPALKVSDYNLELSGLENLTGICLNFTDTKVQKYRFV